jgi:hypothetical protein
MPAHSRIGSVLSLTVLIVLSAASFAAAQQSVRLLGASCTAGTEQVAEPKTGRTFLLDYPCDLSPRRRSSSGYWSRGENKIQNRKGAFLGSVAPRV